MQAQNPLVRFHNQRAFQPDPLLQWSARPKPVLPILGGMDIGGILNASHAAAADAQLRQQFQHHSMQMDPSAYGLGHHQAAMSHHHQQPQMNHHHQQHQQQIQMQSHDPNALSFQMNQQHHPSQMNYASFVQRHDDHSNIQNDDFGAMRPKSEGAPKAFACGTCSKGFARRSDLARHERIHSGIRPHACDHPGCGKQFIQRSALTVHARVHTGEKPHMCERCGKPFSDSSSLARHRRIHSGKRPYKCPYANCQKTFTRRTTLTRHQNHHTGTIEQAAAETNAKLSTGQNGSQYGSTSGSSRHSTASPADRTLSVSPGQDLPPMSNMQRQSSDYGYMSQNHSLPPHMRNDFQQQNSPRSAPTMQTGSSLANYTSAPQPRPTTTSHPTNFNPPQTLEPPANGTNSGSASPHMGALGWGSPSHGTLPSPDAMGNFAYPDPGYGQHPLYYPGSNIRRPQSTEPEDYGIRPRMTHSHLANHVPMTADWSAMPVGMHHHGIKEERFVV